VSKRGEVLHRPREDRWPALLLVLLVQLLEEETPYGGKLRFLECVDQRVARGRASVQSFRNDRRLGRTVDLLLDPANLLADLIECFDFIFGIVTTLDQHALVGREQVGIRA
jgi:hypothetical protein